MSIDWNRIGLHKIRQLYNADLLTEDEVAFLNSISKRYDQYSEEVRTSSEKRRKQAAINRQRVNERSIEFFENQLKVGMLVKVEANSATKWREVTDIKGSRFTGMHITFKRKGRKAPWEKGVGGYITDHCNDKIRAVGKWNEEDGTVKVESLSTLMG